MLRTSTPRENNYVKSKKYFSQNWCRNVSVYFRIQFLVTKHWKVTDYRHIWWINALDLLALYHLLLADTRHDLIVPLEKNSETFGYYRI